MAFYESNIEMQPIIEEPKVGGNFGFAAVSQRFRAAVVDLVFILIVTVVELFVTVPNNLTFQNYELTGLTFIWLIPATWIFFPFFFWLVFKGQTPGKMLFHIRIVRDDGSPMIFYNAVLRFFGQSLYLIPMAIAWSLINETTSENLMTFATLGVPLAVFGLYWYLIYSSTWKQGLHDRIAGTIVINTRAEAAIPARPMRVSGLNSVSVSLQPLVTYGLIAANVLIFFISHGANAYFWGATNRTLIFEFHEYHRLWTAMFLHADEFHLFSNMLALYFIGYALEARIGHLRFGVLYLLTGFVGSLTSIALNDPNVSSVGASGAVFGIFGALVVHEWKYRAMFGYALNSGISKRIAISMFLNLLNGFAPRTGEVVMIDNWGHSGGFLSGIVAVAIVMFTVEYVTDEEHHTVTIRGKHLRWLNTLVGGMAAIIILMLVASLFAAGTVYTVTVDNFTVEIPRGWRFITEFDSPQFAEVCPSQFPCQLITAPMDAPIALTMKNNTSQINRDGTPALIADAIGASIQRQNPDMRLNNNGQITIANRPAVWRSYQSADTEVWFFVFKPEPSVVEVIVIDGSREEVEAHREELRSIVNSIQPVSTGF